MEDMIIMSASTLGPVSVFCSVFQSNFLLNRHRV